MAFLTSQDNCERIFEFNFYQNLLDNFFCHMTRLRGCTCPICNFAELVYIYEALAIISKMPICRPSPYLVKSKVKLRFWWLHQSSHSRNMRSLRKISKSISSQTIYQNSGPINRRFFTIFRFKIYLLLEVKFQKRPKFFHSTPSYMPEICKNHFYKFRCRLENMFFRKKMCSDFFESRLKRKSGKHWR